MNDVICMPMCVKHDCPRPCSICDKEQFDKENLESEKEDKNNSKKIHTLELGNNLSSSENSRLMKQEKRYALPKSQVKLIDTMNKVFGIYDKRIEIEKVIEIVILRIYKEYRKVMKGKMKDLKNGKWVSCSLMDFEEWFEGFNEYGDKLHLMDATIHETVKQIFNNIKQHKNFSSLGTLKEYIEYLEKKWIKKCYY